ncbi:MULTISPECIES: acyl carrier protein [Burkholderia]|uniref:Acyl carrier protein n=2 Tax=Burkholderia gladioli TaxID=28095 RepID=A0A2A7SCY0_BURGA|nr:MULTISPECIES: acyl carrier protein [Burkholderia]AEA62698.1 acyl carrier protein [Burkholderia gladioli BSR3]ATF89427.1 acyl carrier protein [Burkholderia gladioli pv. gladioli]MBJ9660496.1 acyl carrier protein [Burkholderia gladioli]MBJ9710533.1 acyl carrier protein [Burkholderia gladioli]MBU9158452.1 acyl carrier protein [Burkholderia gladioli]
MDLQQIVELIARHTKEVIPGLDRHTFRATDALKDLGANSLDRSEIVIMTLESLSLRVPLVELAGARNIGELAQVLHAKL